MADKLNNLAINVIKDAYRPVEDKTINFINLLQTKPNLDLIVLTSRGLDVLDSTAEHLYSFKLNFSIKGINDSFVIKENQLKFGYKKGVICCEGGNKGSVLKYLLKLIPDKSIDQIIFVDDTYSKAKDVESAFVGSDLNVLSLHYCPNLVGKFDYLKSCEYIRELPNVNFEEEFFWLMP